MEGPEWKSVVLVEDVVQKFSKGRQMVLDAFVETLFTAKQFLFPDRNMQFLGCDVVVDCLQKSIPRFVEFFASQLPTDWSNSTVDH